MFASTPRLACCKRHQSAVQSSLYTRLVLKLSSSYSILNLNWAWSAWSPSFSKSSRTGHKSKVIHLRSWPGQIISIPFFTGRWILSRDATRISAVSKTRVSSFRISFTDNGIRSSNLHLEIWDKVSFILQIKEQCSLQAEPNRIVVQTAPTHWTAEKISQSWNYAMVGFGARSIFFGGDCEMYQSWSL